MYRIIRSKAIETSSQSTSNQSHSSDSSQINLHLSPETAFIYGGSVASSSTILSEIPPKTNIVPLTTPNKAQNTDNWSTSLQALLHQPPSILPYLVLLGSIAFFGTVVVWAWTGKIEQVSHLQGKFVSIGELHKLHRPNSSIVSSIHSNHLREAIQPEQTKDEIESQDKSLVLLATVPHQVSAFIKKEDKVDIQLDEAPNLNKNLISGKVISISSDDNLDKKSKLIDQLVVTIDSDSLTENKQGFTIKVGQIATAKVIHQSRIADILLSSVKQI